MPDRPEPSRDPLRTEEPVLSLSTTNSGGGGERTPAAGPTATKYRDGVPLITGYTIEAEIARGGMGRVYRGRELVLDREVAIKTLLPGAHADRFVVESKITARLPHPGIPPVYALGKHSSGEPFLAMKLIRGRTLADLLKERASPSDDLPRFIQIFEQIAQAVGFAHAQGIIHRDLKPNNVMVGTFGEVQVMDWGLAKDLAQADETIVQDGVRIDIQHTQSGSVLGTPGYMSPEQARGEIVDARADVFSLGSVLAAILTGKPAFAGTTVKEVMTNSAAADLAEVRRRLSASGADAELIALATHCLAPASADRIADAEDVAQGVAAYRANVQQRLRQAETQAAAALVREAEGRKRRNVWLALAAACFVGVIAASVLAYRENEARKYAEQQEGLARQAAAKEKTANDLTAQRLAQIETINNSVFDIFTEFDIDKVKKGPEPVEYVLAQRLIATGKKLDAKAIHDPLTLARLQDRLGNTLLSLGEAEAAIEFLTSAQEIRQTQLGSDHPLTIASMNNLALGYKDAGQFDLALPLFEETLKLTKAKRGSDHSEILASMNNLAGGYLAAGNPGLALPLYEEALQLRKAKFGSDHPDTLNSMGNLAQGYQAAGKFDLALPLLEATLQLKSAKFGPDHHSTLTSMNNLAQGYQAVGKLDQALPLFEETLALMKAKLGPDHPDTLTCTDGLTAARYAAGKVGGALPLMEETLQLRKAKLGLDHPDTFTSMNNLAEAYEEANKLDLALPLYEETLELRKAKLGPDHPDTLISLNNLAAGYMAVGKLDLALPLYEEAVRRMKAKLGPDHPNSLSSMNNLAAGYRKAGKLDLALPLYKETLALRKEKLGPDHPSTLTSMNNLAIGYRSAGQLDLALPLMQETFDRLKAKLGPDHPHTVSTANSLGKTYCEAGLGEKAVPVLNVFIAGKRKQLPKDHPDLAGLLAAVSLDLLQCDQPAVAEELLRECLAIHERIEPTTWTTFNTQSLLGGALLGQQKYAEAEPLLLKGYAGLKAREKLIPQEGATRIPEALDRLIQLYFDTDKLSELEKWQAERTKYSK